MGYMLGNYDIREVQAVMLDILSAIDEICRRHGFRYVLNSGTMLGAIRHQGFIPWDDDADILLPRDDYEEFIKVANRELDPKYRFECMENNKNYPYNFGKVFNVNTVYTEKASASLDICHGVYVDVFPMDYVDDKDYLKHTKKIGKYTQLRYYHLGFGKHPRYKSLAKCIPLKFINAGADRHMKYYGTKGDRLCKMCHFGKNKPVIPKSVFTDVIEVPFEGRMFFVPREYDSFLRGRYGDYMQLPPVEKQRRVHNLGKVRLWCAA